VKKSSAHDAFALIAYLGRERGFESVRTLLDEAEASGGPLLMNEINVGEVYFLIAKERSIQKAEEFLHRLETLPIRVLANTFSQVLDAARLKAQFPVSYADAFAIAAAIRENARLVTGDPELRSVAHLIDIAWI